MIEYEGKEQADKIAAKVKEMEQLYRNVFSSAEGRKVLADILMACHFGETLNNDEERIQYNVGVAIAVRSGMMGEVDRLLTIGED